MKKTFTSLYGKIILLFFFLTALIIYGCHKELSDKAVTHADVLLQSKNIDINKLKTAYTKGIKSNLKNRSSDISQQSLSDMVGTLNVDWSTYTLQEYADSTESIEFDMPDDTSLYILGSVNVGDTVKWKNKTKAVFLLKNDTLQMSFFMKVIEDQSAPDSLSAIDSLHYLQVPTTFTGQILYFTLDRQLINGFELQNGTIISSLSPNALPVSGQDAISNKHKKNEITITTSCYTESVTYVGVNVPDAAINAYGGFLQVDISYTLGYIQVCGTSITDTGGGFGGGNATGGGVSGGGGSVSGGGTVVKCAATTVSSVHGKVIEAVAGCPVVNPPVTPPQSAKPCPGDVVKNPTIARSSATNRNGGRFGNTRLNADGSPHPHKGLDIYAVPNTPIYSMYSGIVTRSVSIYASNYYGSPASFGNLIEIQSTLPNGTIIKALYGHMNTVAFTVGQKIQQGIQIGLSGRTGNAQKGFDPHVHVQITINGTKVNPEPYTATKFDSSGQPGKSPC